MIPRTPRICQTETAQTREPLGDWQTQLGAAIRDPAELLRYLELPGSLLAGAKAASDTFALRVPLSYLEKIKKGDINDPLLRQILPLDAEMLSDPHFSQDPVGDIAAMAVPGVLHKYHGRVLLITTPACGIHCRYYVDNIIIDSALIKTNTSFIQCNGIISDYKSWFNPQTYVF